MNLVFLLEEASMKEFLDLLLPRILPSDIAFQTIPHQGKSDLQKSIPIKIKNWNISDTKFVIEDSADCRELKAKLLQLSEAKDKEVLVRIACKELESWYLGDLSALEKAYHMKNLQILSGKKLYRDPDKIANPKQELKKLIPAHQQLSGARKIAPLIDIENNTSESFRFFIKGVQKLCRSNT